MNKAAALLAILISLPAAFSGDLPEVREVLQKPAYKLDRQESEYLKVKADILAATAAYTNATRLEEKRRLRGGMATDSWRPDSFQSVVVKPYMETRLNLSRRLAIMEDDRPDLKTLSSRISSFNATSVPVVVRITNTTAIRKAAVDEAVRKFRAEQEAAKASGGN